ncbi:MAG: tetratricopeptide repeat protein [Cyanobacteria bacterium CRU_2_1]|nr:tetratricopeptide repeat protein [Cyanobacteria bacterium RU_5_0]NJR63136.1 tetratricopeptide repeat protein [Cyanobacteria bacterium CRU_2_1]
MKDMHIHEAKLKPWKWLGVALIGIPIVTGVLILAEVNLSTQIDSIRWHFSSLDEAYRYPFDESLSGNRSLVSGLEQEIAFYQERVRENPEGAFDRSALASAYLRMARVTGQSNWYLLAEQAAQQSLVSLPIDNSDAIAVLARVAEARHDFPGALRLAEQVTNERDAVAIQLTSYLAMGKLNEANQAADRLIDLTLSMNAFTLKALVNATQGNDQEALQNFQYALEVEEPIEFTNSARTRTLLGRYYYERGQLELAGDLYREALHISPEYPQALLNLAQLDIRQGRYSSADRHYAQLVEKLGSNPTVYDALILRGRARIKVLQGNPEAANPFWDDAEMLLRQTSTDTNAGFGHRRDLARLLLERGRSQDIPEAVALMQAEVKLRRDADTLDTYAWALSQAGDWQEAQHVIQEAIDLGTRDAALFHRAGTIEQALGNSAQANLHFQEAQQIDPTFGDRALQSTGLGAGLGS